MKRVTLIFAIMLATGMAKAQTIDSIPHHNLGPHSGQTETFMEMSDGSILGGVLLADENPFNSIGYVLHKVSRCDSNIEISDTLFIPYNPQLPWHFTGKDPDGDGYVLAEFYDDDENESCWLKIRHFDDDLNLDTTEIVVHLADFFASSSDLDPFLDNNGDIILSYYLYPSSSTPVYFARIGLDGTIKHQKSIDNLNINLVRPTVFKVFRESPLEYCFWGYINDRVNCYFLDSLFNVTKHYSLPKMSGSPDYVNYDNQSINTKLLHLDEGCFLASRTYSRSYNLMPYIEDDGVAVIKYDTNLNVLAQTKFLSEPYIQYDGYGAQSIGLERSKDGYIYFAYFTHQYYNESQVSVVKMDEDLNIIWQRHCLERHRGRMYGRMIVLDDNSVAVLGNTRFIEMGHVNRTEAFYIIVHDDYDGMEEQGVIIRPYTYYPNPAQDQLHLQYSPDVKPTQIELYDLQGRLVKTQRNGLESLNLQGLPAGTYTMRVTLEGGKVYSDKVVKE